MSIDYNRSNCRFWSAVNSCSTDGSGAGGIPKNVPVLDNQVAGVFMKRIVAGSLGIFEIDLIPTDASLVQNHHAATIHIAGGATSADDRGKQTQRGPYPALRKLPRLYCHQ